MAENKSRMNVLNAGSKNELAVFVVRCCPTSDTATEYMASVYPVLKDGDTVATTFEFALFRLHPDVPVNFDKYLFDQPKLAPLLPAMVNYEMEEKTFETAMIKARMLLDYLMLWAEGFPLDPPYPSSFTQKAG